MAVAVADVTFELVAPHVHALTPAGIAGGYLYEAAIVKYGLAIVAGMWLWRSPLRRRLRLILTALAVISLVYLVVLHLTPGGFSWLMNSFSRSTNFLSVFYAVWLTCFGLWILPRASQQTVYRLLADLGEVVLRRPVLGQHRTESHVGAGVREMANAPPSAR